MPALKLKQIGRLRKLGPLGSGPTVTVASGGGTVPANALLARNTTPFTFRDGSVLTLRSA